MTGVPAGFERFEERGAVLVLRSAAAAPLRASGLADPEECRAAATRTFAGRAAPFSLDVDGLGSVVVRPYLHGGLLGRITADHHAGDGRFLDELAAVVEADAAGVPVSHVLGIVSRPSAVGLRRGWLLSREETGARDLMTFLEEAPEPARRRAVLTAAGRSMRTLHDAGFEHPDLHLRNLLLTTDDRVLVLDFDRVRRHAELSRERRIANLFRFDRYAEKQVARGATVSRADRMRVLRSYAGSEWPERDDLRALAARLARHVRRHARSGAKAAEAAS